MNEKEILENKSQTMNTEKKHENDNIAIIYKNINFIKKNKHILEDVNLKIYQNSITGIMGLSGAGKTSLLKVLCGYVESGDIWIKRDLLNKDIDIVIDNENKYEKEKTVPMDFEDKTVDYDKISPEDMRKFSSYVPQQELLPPFFTVREYLNFVSDLSKNEIKKKNIDGISKNNDLKKLIKNTNKEKISFLLDSFNLSKQKDTKIGMSHKGLSGGEKKRLEIISEILRNKKIIFLDEPTTGLDVLNAIEVMKVLREYADQSDKHKNKNDIESGNKTKLHNLENQDNKFLNKKRGNSVILTIHQPAKNLFFMLDYLILIKDGKILCNLKTSKVVEFFEMNNFHLNYLTNPAEFFFTDFIDKYEFKNGKFVHKTSQKLISYSYDQNMFENKINYSDINSNKSDKKYKYMLEHFKFDLKNNFSNMIILLKRSAKCAFTKKQIISRIFQAGLTGMILGIIFSKLNSTKNVKNLDNLNKIRWIENSRGFLYCVLTNILYNCAHIGLKGNLDISVYRDLYSFRYSNLIYYSTSVFLNSIAILIYPILSSFISLPLVSLNYSILQYFIFFSTVLLGSIYGLSFGMLIYFIFMDNLISAIMVPALLGPMVLLSGMLVRKEHLLSFRILEKMSIPRYAFNILCKNHFSSIDSNFEKVCYDPNFFSLKISFLTIFMGIFVNVTLGYYFFKKKVVNWMIN